MNILIFDPWLGGRLSARAYLRQWFDRVVCVGSVRDFFIVLPKHPPPIRFYRAIFIIPSVRVTKEGEGVKPRSLRAACVLQLAASTRSAGIPTFVCPQDEAPVSFFDQWTGRPLPAEEVFYRAIDPETNTFQGCFAGRDWNWIVRVCEGV